MNFSFKQYLTELMVDVDPDTSPSDMYTDVRKKQMMAKQSPQRVLRQQTQDAKDAQNNALRSDSPTKNLEVQIARKKQELYRLEQQLQQARQKTGASPQVPGQGPH